MNIVISQRYSTLLGVSFFLTHQPSPFPPFDVYGTFFGSIIHIFVMYFYDYFSVIIVYCDQKKKQMDLQLSIFDGTKKIAGKFVFLLYI